MQNKIYRFKLVKISLLFLFVGISVISCKKDEDNITPTPIRDRGVQQIDDSIAIQKYLNTHYYNSTEFNSKDNPTIADIKIDLLQKEGYTLLKKAVDSIEIAYLGVKYKIYYLELKTGGGDKKPSFSDSVLVKYEGFKLDDFSSKFGNVTSPVNLDLPNDDIMGWSQLLPEFSIAEKSIPNPDGTVTYNSPGMGIMFLPSGLAYFSKFTSTVPSYTPIAFKFELLNYSESDHDNDGVPSYLENFGNDKIFNLAFDDTDGDGIANYKDIDDDNDGVFTEYEYKDADNNILMSSDGITPRYLNSLE